MDVDPRKSEGTKSKTSETKKITWTDVPKRFRPVKIERTTHWKKGQNTNMTKHNDTSQSGLGNDHRDHYVNAGLQVLFHMLPIRAAVLSHICDTPNCLTCELSFLFHMMQQARAAPLAVRCAEPSNFLRCLRLLPEATALGLRFPSKLDANVRSVRSIETRSYLSHSKEKTNSGTYRGISKICFGTDSKGMYRSDCTGNHGTIRR